MDPVSTFTGKDGIREKGVGMVGKAHRTGGKMDSAIHTPTKSASLLSCMHMLPTRVQATVQGVGRETCDGAHSGFWQAWF